MTTSCNSIHQRNIVLRCLDQRLLFLGRCRSVFLSHPPAEVLGADDPTLAVRSYLGTGPRSRAGGASPRDTSSELRLTG